MSGTKVPISSLEVGDVIYELVKINVADLADPAAATAVSRSKLSATAKKALRGDKVRRLCIVLVIGTTSVQVTYGATFSGSTALPITIADKSMWYPVDPAPQEEGTLPPLPNPDPNAPKVCWISLRQVQEVSTSNGQVTRIDLKYSPAAVAAIYAAMHHRLPGKSNPEPEVESGSHNATASHDIAKTVESTTASYSNLVHPSAY